MGKGHILAPLERIENIELNGGSGVAVAVKDIIIPLLLDKWVLDETDNTYSYVATVNGLTNTSNPIILLSSVGDEATEDELESYACISNIITAEDSITFIASKKPSISFTVIAKNVVAAEGDPTAVVTELVEKVDGLETQVNENATENAEAITELNNNLGKHTHYYCENKKDNTIYRLQINTDGLPRVYTSTDGGSTWNSYILAKDTDVAIRRVGEYGKNYEVTLPSSNGRYLLLFMHNSNHNGCGFYFYMSQTGLLVPIKEATDVTLNCNYNVISFSCSYSPSMYVFSV